MSFHSGDLAPEQQRLCSSEAWEGTPVPSPSISTATSESGVCPSTLASEDSNSNSQVLLSSKPTSGSSPGLSASGDQQQKQRQQLHPKISSPESANVRRQIESIPFGYQFSEVDKAVSNFIKHQPFNHHYAPNVHQGRSNSGGYYHRHNNYNNGGGNNYRFQQNAHMGGMKQNFMNNMPQQMNNRFKNNNVGNGIQQVQQHQQYPVMQQYQATVPQQQQQQQQQQQTLPQSIMGQQQPHQQQMFPVQQQQPSVSQQSLLGGISNANVLNGMNAGLTNGLSNGFSNGLSNGVPHGLQSSVPGGLSNGLGVNVINDLKFDAYQQQQQSQQQQQDLNSFAMNPLRVGSPMFSTGLRQNTNGSFQISNVNANTNANMEQFSEGRDSFGLNNQSSGLGADPGLSLDDSSPYLNDIWSNSKNLRSSTSVWG